MKQIILGLLITCISHYCLGQAPFATYRKTAVNVSNKDADEKEKELNELTKTDFFVHANANVVSIQDGKKFFPTVNGEVLNYKLRVWTKVKTDTIKTHILPFMIISKVSGNYMDSSAGPTNDATSFFGAPLTFRVAPGFEILTRNKKYNKLFVGLNLDLRLLTIGEAETSKLETCWGGYSSFGFTYMGTGYAHEGNEDTDEAKRHEGKWSFSTLFYLFKSGVTFNKAVFGDHEKKDLTGLELLLRFKAQSDQDSKFNFLIGASHGFTSGAPNYKKWEFRIGVGK